MQLKHAPKNGPLSIPFCALGNYYAGSMWWWQRTICHAQTYTDNRVDNVHMINEGTVVQNPQRIQLSVVQVFKVQCAWSEAMQQ